METETITATKPKRTVSPELKAKMRAGRARAAAERKALGVKRAARRSVVGKIVSIAKAPELLDKAVPRAPREFLGITRTDCPIDCTSGHCVITGVGFCGHPCKGSLQPVYMSNPEVVERHNRARKHLAHVELDKRP